MVVRGTQLVQEACQRHQTSPTASAALGRALLGTLLMGAFREAGEKTQVTFKGDGALAGIQIIAGKLDAQAYSGNNQTESVGTSSR
jgi:molecular chaperone Hsp33